MPPSNGGTQALAETKPRPTRTRGSKTAQAQRAIVRWVTHSKSGAWVGLANVYIVRGMPWFCLFLVGRRLWRMWVTVRRIKVPISYAIARTVLEIWATTEVLFFIYFRWKKKSLESKRSYSPSVLWKEPGERKRLLISWLENINRIHTGNLEERALEAHDQQTSNPDAYLSPLLRTRSNSGGGLASGGRANSGRTTDRTLGHSRKGSSSTSNIHGQERDNAKETCAVNRLISAPSVENFLRFQDEPEAFGLDRSNSSTALAMPKKKSGNLISAPSVENLLRSWDEVRDPAPNQSKSRGPGSANEELLYLKHLELCSWYRMRKGSVHICNDVKLVRRGNVEDFILSYWFDGAACVDDLTPEEKLELPVLVSEVARWAKLSENPKTWEGKNPDLICFRLKNDPFPALHRPLLGYFCTAMLLPAFGSRSLIGLGFRNYRAGSTEYWFRPPNPSSDWFANTGCHRPTSQWKSRQPLVFLHGIGVGPTMCLSFVDRLTRDMGQEHPIFLVDTAAVSMRFSEDVPTGREVTSNIVDMLEVWGFKSAHFVGHSFGSFLIAWMVRYQRSYVTRCTFVDPVCFLLLKVFKDGSELQQVRKETRMDTMEMIIKYFVLTELFVCNFVCRCFFWEESQLDFQDLEDLPTLVVLESEDAIVPTHSVYRLILADRARRRSKTGPAASASAHMEKVAEIESKLQIEWIEGHPHAGFLVDGDVCIDLCARLSRFHKGAAA
mmetsp:Transcript_93494/g.204715  ORF Transcript_93494/g.204715 Transcript_93494/m.204715 type:complete len:724 (+) Transcript_93494:57-2228(+)